MKRFLLLIFVLPILGFSQCPGGFTSQAQIDAFATNYPDCTILNGSLYIHGDDITDLSGLAQIEQCQGLVIEDNLILQNLNGINSNLLLYYVEGTGSYSSISNNASLTSILGLENWVNSSGFESSLYISNNPLLGSLEGLPNTFSSLSFLQIVNNDSLLNLNGIGNISGSEITDISDNNSLIDLTGMGNYNAEILKISDNNSLQSLNGSELGSFGDQLIIENNPVLTDISAIYAGSYIDDGLIIRNNQNLSMCSTAPVCYFLYDNGIEESVWFPGTFENNSPGCNTNLEVEYGCGVVTNDNCTEFSSISYITLGESITANNEFATTSAQTPSCNDVANRQDVWFAFDSDILTSVDVIAEAGFSLQLWEGDCVTLTQVANACGSTALNDITVTPNTSYIVQVWDDGTGRRESGWFNLTVQDGLLSIPEVALTDVKLYPNPANDILNIQSSSRVDKVSIYNMLGQNVLESAYYTNDVSVNISNLSKGMYMAIISSDGRESTYKIAKQ